MMERTSVNSDWYVHSTFISLYVLCELSFYHFATNQVTEADLKGAFKEIDEDNTGMLDIDEFTYCCEMLRMDLDENFDAQKLFIRTDEDDSGYVDFAEYRSAILTFLTGEKIKNLTPERLKRIFEMTDEDGSGFLDFTEFKKACEVLQFGLLDTKKDLKKYFEDIDTDASGLISYEELTKSILL